MLSNKLALVTGAGSGIGEATCKLFAKEGATVIGIDRNDSVHGVINALEAPINTATKHSSYIVDVSNSSQVNDLYKKIKGDYPDQKVPTVIVNCAGITQVIPILEFSEEDFDRIMDVNFKGTFLINQGALRELVANYDDAKFGEYDTYASIINIASCLARTSPEGRAPYCASKAAVDALTRGLCREFGKYKIRCNSLCPGYVLTPMILIPLYEEDNKMAKVVTPLQRASIAYEQAKVCLFLASDLASFVTGSAVVADGGAYLT